MKKMYRYGTLFALTSLLCCSLMACSSDSGSAGSTTGTPSQGSEGSGSSSTANYPEKEVTVIVTAEAGGGTDAVARAVTVPLEEALGKPFVISNEGSAGGLVGMGNIAKASPDGYTLGVFSNTDVANFVYTTEGVTFTLDDFTYIAGLNSTADILVLKANSEYSSLDDFIEASLASPGAMTIGLPSVIQNLSLNLLNQELGIQTTGIVYEGGAKVLSDLLGGHVDAGILSAKFIQQCQEQDLNVLGLMLDERLETFSDVPTFSEQGYAVVNPAVRMLVGPKGIPDDVVAAITEKLELGYADVMRENLLTIGEDPVLRTAEEIQAYLVEDFAMRESLLGS